ncbi:MAG: hypothetical protein PHI32_06030 [Dysgonamonadaceae bacterium]|nr:hypothetical protein [Dysgonamonadaceae bacterium]
MMNNYRKVNMMFLFCVLVAFLLVFNGQASNMSYAQDDESKKLRISTFDIDVTPPIGNKLAYEMMINSWDMGLRAKGVVLIGAGDPIVLVAIDWIGINGDCYDEFRRAIASAAGTVPEKVALHTLHQHDAYRGDNLQDDFILAVVHRLEMAVVNSIKNTKSITHIGIGESEVYKVASNRFILDTKADTVRATRFTTCRDSALRAEPEGVIDPMVSLVSFWNENEPIAVLSYYATHPQSYYRTGIPNPDFPGIARFFRQLAVPDALHIHFNGAGANIGAGKYNDGSKENRLILAERLADGMKRAWESTELLPVSEKTVRWDVESVVLPPDTTKNGLYLERYKAGKAKVDIQCLALNNARILFMPGELFVEYQLAAKKIRPDLFVAMAAYGDYTLGYIPTVKAFSQGGYEVRVSKVTPEVENILMKTMHNLLNSKLEK